MNKKLIYLFALVFSLGFSFTACGDDDDDPVVTPDYAKEAAGTYDGNIKIAELTAIGEIPNSLVLSQVSENKAKVALNEITIPGVTSVKNIAVNNIPVSKDGSTYKLAKTTEKITIDLGQALGGNYKTNVTVEGTIKDGKMALTITTGAVPVFDNGLNITFDGTKK